MHRLVSGPSNLPGYGEATRILLPSASRAMCRSKILLMTSTKSFNRVPVAYFNNSLLTPSGPGARPLCSSFIANSTSVAVIGCLSG